jgi:hypothetical protein
MQNLMDKVIHYYTLLPTQIKPNFSLFPPSWQVDSTQGPKRAPNTACGTSSSKKKPKTGCEQPSGDEGMESVPPSGSLEWYCRAIESPNGTGVTPLIKTGRIYEWAFADARIHGTGVDMKVHHNMLVVVESGHNITEHMRCSCAIFRNQFEPKRCVHTLYVRANWEHLRSMAFAKEDDVVTIKQNNSSTVCYYVDGCFVRTRGNKGLRCDSDKSYNCRHIARVREALHQVVEPGEEESACTPDSYAFSSDDDGAEVLSLNPWISKIAKTIQQIHYPYRDEVKRGVMERLLFGFSRDKEGTPLGPLKPRIPISIKCKCGLSYNRRGYKETDPVTVYMRAPHCAQSLPCMVLKCQRGEPECTLHYTGIEDGLWRASKTVAIELDLLVRCARDSVRFDGQSLTAHRDSISDMYDMVSNSIPTVSFLEARAFREAVYGIDRFLHHDCYF